MKCIHVSLLACRCTSYSVLARINSPTLHSTCEAALAQQQCWGCPFERRSVLLDRGLDHKLARSWSRSRSPSWFTAVSCAPRPPRWGYNPSTSPIGTQCRRTNKLGVDTSWGSAPAATSVVALGIGSGTARRSVFPGGRRASRHESVAAVAPRWSTSAYVGPLTSAGS